MSKKLLLIIIILNFFIVLAVPVKAEIIWTYVGIKIISTKNPQDQTFCLPAGTTMSIMDGIAVLPDPKTTDSTTCAGGTILSNLVNLDTEKTYGIKLEVSFCQGFLDNGLCWYKGAAGDDVNPGQSCTEVCADKGGTVSANCCEADTNCTASKHFGADCPLYCQLDCPVFFSTGSNECFSCHPDSSIACKTDPNYMLNCGFQPYNGYWRTCACKFPFPVFNYSFTI